MLDQYIQNYKSIDEALKFFGEILKFFGISIISCSFVLGFVYYNCKKFWTGHTPVINNIFLSKSKIFSDDKEKSVVIWKDEGSIYNGFISSLIICTIPLIIFLLFLFFYLSDNNAKQQVDILKQTSSTELYFFNLTLYWSNIVNSFIIIRLYILYIFQIWPIYLSNLNIRSFSPFFIMTIIPILLTLFYILYSFLYISPYTDQDWIKKILPQVEAKDTTRMIVFGFFIISLTRVYVKSMVDNFTELEDFINLPKIKVYTNKGEELNYVCAIKRTNTDYQFLDEKGDVYIIPFVNIYKIQPYGEQRLEQGAQT